MKLAKKYGLNAITIMAAAIVFYFGYRIEDKDIVQMQEEINARTA